MNFTSLLYSSFSKILSKFDNRDIGRNTKLSKNLKRSVNIYLLGVETFYFELV